MHYVEFIEDVRNRSGIADLGHADRAIAAVVSVLGSGLCGTDADALAENLPDAVAARLRNSCGGAELADVQEFYARVAARAGTTAALALEETQVVLQVVAEHAGYEALIRARKHLPGDVAELLAPRAAFSEAPPREYVQNDVRVVHETLASGRPGSRHPLSEAHGGTTQEHSVARRSNPHAERKLSSVRR